MARRLVRLQRKDGVVQRYRTTQESLKKKGYEPSTRRVRGHEVVVWVKQIPQEPAPVQEPEGVAEAIGQVPSEPVSTGIYEVVFYTEYKQEGRSGTERYELRTCVESSAENAEMAALQKIMSILPDDYREFLDGSLGIFNIGERTGVSQIDLVSSYRGVRYFRFFAGGMPGAAKKTWGE